jgi:hypothetical protein
VGGVVLENGNEKPSESPVVDVGMCQLSDDPIQSDRILLHQEI